MGIKDFFFKDDNKHSKGDEGDSVGEKNVESKKVTMTVEANVGNLVEATNNIANAVVGLSGVEDDKLKEYRGYFEDLPKTKTYEMFMRALDSLKDQPLEERVKYLGAFAGLSAAGVSKDQVLMDCESMLKNIDSEIGDFTTEWSSTFTTEVEGRSQQIEKHMYVIQELRDQILEAENKIENLKSERAKLEIELGVVKASFMKAGAEYKDSVTRIVDKIKAYV